MSRKNCIRKFVFAAGVRPLNLGSNSPGKAPWVCRWPVGLMNLVKIALICCLNIAQNFYRWIDLPGEGILGPEALFNSYDSLNARTWESFILLAFWLHKTSYWKRKALKS